MFATLATRTFRNSPWDLGQGNSLTTLFSEDNLTCTMSRRGAVTLMIVVTKELVSDSAQAVITVAVIRDVCPHHNATRGMPYQKMESQCIEYRAYVIEDPLLNVGTLHNPLAEQTPQELEEVELDPGCDRTRPMASIPGWAVTRLTVSASSLAAATFQLPRSFPRLICN